jgi:hypothetical protein
MARYTLRLAEPGTFLYGEDGPWAVADTIADARAMLAECTQDGREPIFLHPLVARGRVVYAADIENGECHEDAEPGDTTYDFARVPDLDTWEPRGGEVLCWQLGAPPLCDWEVTFAEAEPVAFQDIEPGRRCYRKRDGWMRTVGTAYRYAGRWCINAAPDGDPRPGSVRAYTWRTLTFFAPEGYQRTRILTIDGEEVARSESERVLRDLLALRQQRLGMEWEAGMLRDYYAAHETAAT